MPQLPLEGLSNICPSRYHCEPTPNHSVMGALVCKPSSGPNRSRLGRQLSWCVVLGLPESVGEHLLTFHSGWTDVCEPHWHVPGCWYNHKAEQQNAPVYPCSCLWLKGLAYQPVHRMLQWYQWPHHRLSKFPMPFSSPCHQSLILCHTQWKHGRMATLGTCSSQCHSHLMRCQEPEVFPCVKCNPELINIQTSSCCHSQYNNTCVYCADWHLGLTLLHSITNME